MSRWSAKATKDLIKDVAEHGNLTAPSGDYPFGRVQDWTAVSNAMARQSHGYNLDSLQAKWSREARGRLLQVKSSVHFENGTDGATMLLYLVDVAYATRPAAAPAAAPAAKTEIQYPTKAELKNLTEKEREDVLAAARKFLEDLREAMKEEDGGESVSREMMDFVAESWD